MTNTNKQWHTPTLRVFVRAEAEQGVLSQCKSLLQQGCGPSEYFNCCYTNVPIACGSSCFGTSPF